MHASDPDRLAIVHGKQQTQKRRSVQFEAYHEQLEYDVHSAIPINFSHFSQDANDSEVSALPSPQLIAGSTSFSNTSVLDDIPSPPIETLGTTTTPSHAEACPLQRDFFAINFPPSEASFCSQEGRSGHAGSPEASLTPTLDMSPAHVTLDVQNATVSSLEQAHFSSTPTSGETSLSASLSPAAASGRLPRGSLRPSPKRRAPPPRDGGPNERGPCIFSSPRSQGSSLGSKVRQGSSQAGRSLSVQQQILFDDLDYEVEKDASAALPRAPNASRGMPQLDSADAGLGFMSFGPPLVPCDSFTADRHPALFGMGLGGIDWDASLSSPQAPKASRSIRSSPSSSLLSGEEPSPSSTTLSSSCGVESTRRISLDMSGRRMSDASGGVRISKRYAASVPHKTRLGRFIADTPPDIVSQGKGPPHGYVAAMKGDTWVWQVTECGRRCGLGGGVAWWHVCSLPRPPPTPKVANV